MTQRTEGDRKRRRDLADAASGELPRLLPWAKDGKTCYLSTDGGSNSALSRLADDMEDVQLDVGTEVLEQSRPILANPMSPHSEVRYAALRLSECLDEAIRIAESRGDRIPLPDDEEAEDGPTLSAEAFG
ncbi:hypothetical protein [Streptomyces sp. RPA4-5]|uniref:hypothetical protein n=1 Tax=Streptomyces sp. RPA4-5 TaxID=2721245 RepID=UPI002001E1F6|nr:hypothetical protein [Streptomyces sp. RPA4-5]